MLNQSFRQVFVATTPVLLPSGSTVDLAPGQVAITDGATYVPTVAPTYGTNKAIQLWLGMPDVSHLPLMAGIPQTNQASKLIKGKLFKKFRKKGASRGHTQLVAIGYDGLSATKGLDMKCGESRTVYLEAQGNPINKLYTNTQFGRKYRIEAPNCDDCGTDSCADVDQVTIAQNLANKVNADAKWNGGGGPLIRAKVVTSTAISLSGATIYDVFDLTLADDNSNAALARVAVQAPANKVKPVERIGRSGIFSTYRVTLPDGAATPSFTTANTFIISDCATCPTGYTANAAGFVYTVKRADTGSGANLTTLASNYAIAAAGESAIRTNFDPVNQVSTYLIVSNTANQTAVGTDQITFIGDADGKCVLTTPVVTNYVAAGSTYALPRTYTITVADDVCGNSRLAEIQAALPLNTITQVGDGDCVHSFSTVQLSDPFAVDCGVNDIKFNFPPSFEGMKWDAPAAATPDLTVRAGVVFEAAVVNRVTNDCLYDYYPYEADTIHITVSEYNEDYTASPFEQRWPVTTLRNVKYPQGVGQKVREDEKKSLSYFLMERSQDPAVRQAEGFSFNTDPNQYYDEYTLEYDFKYKVLGWSDTYTDSYHQVVYFPEGQGAAFEQAVLTYANTLDHVEVEFS